MKLLATSDLHLSYEVNRHALDAVSPHPDDWLIVAGDTGQLPDYLATALEVLTPKFARIVWAPGNHDLWCPADAVDLTRGEARYRELVALCRRFGALTPEDPYAEWPDEPGTFLVPMFLLYDYSFRPSDVNFQGAVRWARETGVLATDERLLDPAPWLSREAWCEARCRLTEARLNDLPAGARTVLINHWPLRYDLARPPRIPRFSIWSGTTRTESWPTRYRARAVVSGHLHMRTTLFRHGVRFEEVSLGYPRDWRGERGIDWYLREILPGDGNDKDRWVPARDPFFL